jgi:hypothetical protein
MCVGCIILEKSVMTSPTEKNPLRVIFAFRALTCSGIHSNFGSVYQFSYEKYIRRAMRFMTICAGEDVIAALGRLVRRAYLGTSIVCSASAVLFCIPAECMKVPAKGRAADRVRIVVAVCTESDKVR